jgi:hypothetical protein
MDSEYNWAQFAPSLAHLLPALEEHEPVLCGWGSGPQPGTTGTDWAGDAENLTVCVIDPNTGPDLWVAITATGCFWYDDGGRYDLTFDQFLRYLAQLPRPLYAFSRCAD